MFESKLPLMMCFPSYKSKTEVTAAECLWGNTYIKLPLCYFSKSQVITRQHPISPPDISIEVPVINAKLHTPPVCSRSSSSFVPVFKQKILIEPFFVPTAILFIFFIYTKHKAVYTCPYFSFL